MVVVKLGGAAAQSVEEFAEDAAAQIRAGRRLVLVHGGSDDTNRLSEQLGHPPRFITSPSGHTSRRTDARTLEIMQMACRGALNQRVVAALQRRGVNAVGVSGVDGRVWEGERKAAVRSVEDGRIVMVRDDYTGTVSRVNVSLLRTLMEAGFTPVLCPPAISTNNEPINVDADRAAAVTAAALGASDLLLLTSAPGLLRQFPDESSLIRRIPRGQAESAQEFAQGRMKKKVMGATEALVGGVKRVVIGDARRARPIEAALAGEGTVLE
ncbi:MAG: [LysW]-aminoadipate kinase [Planctomycetes bacterium]|nr:[LysW]-aminoadipate kinase [Planctomycetota bacterium]